MKTRTMALAAVSAALAATPGTALAATTAYPNGGSHFDTNTDGWAGSATSCGALSAGGLLCNTVNEQSGNTGNPPGSIATRTTITLNALGLFRGEGTWTSPDFTVPASAQVDGATVALDRMFNAGSLVDVQPSSAYSVSLLDRTAGTSRALTTETVNNDASQFATHSAAVPASAVQPGHRYALTIQTVTSSSVAGTGLLGSTVTRYDNVRLLVSGSGVTSGTGDGGSTNGTGGTSPIGDQGAEGSTGVTVLRRAVSDSTIASLLRSVNVSSEVGNGPGGSVVPKSKCTIYGTSKSDHIKGTKGNDVICGLGGNDRIDGRGGNDVIDTGNGNDVAAGSTGKDALIGVRGKDRLSGNSGADRIGGGKSADRINGGAGGDRLNGGSSGDRISGSSGNDRIAGSSGNDRLAGNSGNDRVAGNTGSDRIDGGAGADRLAGNSGNDRIMSRDHKRDVVDGGSGRDTVTGDRSVKSADRVRHVERRR